MRGEAKVGERVSLVTAAWAAASLFSSFQPRSPTSPPPQTRVVYASDPPATLPGHHHPLDSTTTRQESDCPVKSGNRNEGNEKQRVRCQINLLTSNKFSKCQWRRKKRGSSTKMVWGFLHQYTSWTLTESCKLYTTFNQMGKIFTEDMNMWESAEGRIQWVAGM